MGLISRVSSRTYRLPQKQSKKTKKVKRRAARDAKAAAVAPRPLAGGLRPVVQCCTFRYNAKQRLGRGFTQDEIKGAGMSETEARKIGVTVDKRRRNKSAENLSRNVQRLKEYKAKIIIVKQGDQVEQSLDRKIMPVAGIPQQPVEARAITADKKGSVYQAFHMARANSKWAGQREKRRIQKAA